jgi:3-oxoacyl-[acyl-carrier protein] reductase
MVMTQHVATQVGPFNIRVNCISPETILTDSKRGRIPQAQQTTLAEVHPLRRLGTVEDVAEAALYLAQPPVFLDAFGAAKVIRLERTH